MFISTFETIPIIHAKWRFHSSTWNSISISFVDMISIQLIVSQFRSNK